MRAFVTGALGFLGSHVWRRLRNDGWEVVIFDRKIPDFNWHAERIAFIPGECGDQRTLTDAMVVAQPDVVFHLAALADVRRSLEMPDEQFQQNYVLTRNVLTAMRAAKVNRIAFTSTAVVYGDTPHVKGPIYDIDRDAIIPGTISERGYWFPQQTSIYGAMKLASEALIEAYCHGYGLQADIYRLVSVVGAGYRHGNLMDFYRKLKTDPHRLQLMGSPTQQKYYIAVDDVTDAIARTVTQARAMGTAEIWNISHHEPNSIRDAITSVAFALGIPFPELIGGAAWPGDLPQLVLDCAKLRALGWDAKVPITYAMRETVEDLIARGIA